MNQEILALIKERGLLMEKEVFDLVERISDPLLAKDFLERLERSSGQKLLTKSSLTQHFSAVKGLVSHLPGEHRELIERTFVTLGVSVEIQKEHEIVVKKEQENKMQSSTYQVYYASTKNDKKLEVQDFTSYFRARYQQLQKILLQRPDLPRLISINKISSDRQQVSIIGMVKDKRQTKNQNLILTFEDLTGEISVLVKNDHRELFAQALELQLDDVVALKASGNRDMLFVHDLYYPDAFLPEKTKFEEDISIAFISDIHCGSDRHLSQSMGRFLDWLQTPDAAKIRYLFITGDTVDGVGIFPGQESVLRLKSMKEQYALLASYLQRVPSHITMFLCPGQHDAVRVAEPQPIIGSGYAPALHSMDNMVLVTNPSLVVLKEGQREFKVLMYHGASIHSFIHEIPELREMKAHKTPAKAVAHMLKRRHLAPTHSSAVYIPYADKDPLVIAEVPDVLCTGEVHRLDIETYHGVLIITGSCWQAQTPFEEKVGNIPDPAKVPVLNLKTRELKIYDFGVEEEIQREY